MKLRTKLIVSFAVVVFLVGGIGWVSFFINDSIKTRLTKESELAIDEIEMTGELGLQLYQSLTRTQYLIEDQYRETLAGELNEETPSVERIIYEINDANEHFLACLREAKKNLSSGYSERSASSEKIMQQVNSLEEKFHIYTSLIAELQELSSEDYYDAKEFFTITIEPYFRNSLLPLIEQVRNNIKDNHQAKVAELNERLNTYSYWLGLATIVALGVTLLLALFLYRSIADPLKKIAGAAQDIGRGNLENRIDYHSNDELGQLSDAFNQMTENLSRTTVSRDYVDSIIESMADLLIVTDEQFHITRINSAGISMLNADETELVGKQIDWIFKQNKASLMGNGTSGSPKEALSHNASLRGRDGQDIPVSVSKGPITTSSGDIRGYVIVASDISAERKTQQKLTRSLKEKQVMLSEIHHRVKNNLAVISGLLQMQMWEADNEHAASALKESQMRVQSIALVHEKLYQTESLSYIHFDKYIQELLEAISNTFLRKNGNIAINADLEEVILNINQAVPCSLLLNEVVTNAMKHAFSEQEKGMIKVSLSREGKEIYLRIHDNGKGLQHSEEKSNSLGMSLIETLCKQVNGELKIKAGNGTNVLVSFTQEEVTALEE